MQKQVEVEPDQDAKQDAQEEQPRAEDLEESKHTTRLDGITIFCPLCKDYLAHSVTTACEHTFCEVCLAEYLIFLDECPDCCAKIRNQKHANNILLDNLILDYIKKFEFSEI